MTLELDMVFVDLTGLLERAAQCWGDGNPEEARQLGEEVLRHQPDNAEAQYLLGMLAHESSDTERALDLLSTAARLAPNNALIHNNYGTVLRGEGRLDEAIACYRHALSLHPRYADAHHNLADALHAQGQLAEAIVHYHRAIELDGTAVQPRYGLGTAYCDGGHYHEAIAWLKEAQRLDPSHYGATYNLAAALYELGEHEWALEQQRRAVDLDPCSVEALSALLYQLQLRCDWDEIATVWDRLREAIGQRPHAAPNPFPLLALPTSAAAQRELAERWVRAKLAPLAATHQGSGLDRGPTPPQRTRRKRRKRRVGYLSADFRQHPVGHLIPEMLELHDRQRFEVIGYSLSPDDGSPERLRIAQACDDFVDISTWAYLDIAREIEGRAVDILVDLMGYTKKHRAHILALRPAPVQVNYLGYPGTMGADFIDYIVADRFIIPPDQQQHYTERVVYLPDTYQPNDRQRPIADHIPSREECGLPPDGFVFCCFNGAYKITPPVYSIWMRLVAAVPGSVLWLLEFNPWAEATLKAEAAKRGIDPERVLIAPRLPRPEHLARHKVADLFLDTVPYNAHTTASDALWAGLPIVTCAGETFAGRVCGSLLQAAGLPELVTASLGEYEWVAQALAVDPELLSRYRIRLEQTRLQVPLFDTERYTRNLEDAYLTMWQEACTRSNARA